MEPMAASPLDVRKSSAFPKGVSNDLSGSAAGGEAAMPEEDAAVKQSFTANRQAQPEDKPNLLLPRHRLVRAH